MSILILTDILAFGLCIAILLLGYHRRRAFPLPPGPRRWPLFGNTFMIPLTDAHIFYKNLGESLGTKMIYLEALGQSILVLNDISMAQDLLDKRSSMYSNRLQFPMLTDLIGYRTALAFMPYGNGWRIRRRMFQQHFSENLPGIQDRAIRFIRKSLLPNLLEQPGDFNSHIRNCIAGLSISITYGLPVQRRNDPLIQFSIHSSDWGSTAAAPGKYLVNVIPWLKYVPGWIPGAGFKRTAKQIREVLYQLENDFYNRTLKMMESGDTPLSFVAETLERHRESPEFELQAEYTKQVASHIFTAAFETTSATLNTFMLAILIRPDIQLKVQQEIDAVVGTDCLPEYADIYRLPYLSALVKEVFRWNPPAPTGIPHTTDKADTYMGFHVPRNCLVIANTYAMLRNEELFPDPNEFNPERFLINGVLRDDLPDPEIIATFGFGRRICPGSNMARSTIYLAIASILYLFDISPALDAEGNPIKVEPQFAPVAIISEPLHFPCRITPRKGKDVNNLLRDDLGAEFI